jgi:cation diffusion facilitator CzcD-associated flavoprotein CzcO
MRTDHVDVLIVGAGLSGIGAACHLERECPGRSYAILEARDSVGGTWDLFRYPGIRSDSDMHTLGYSFKPWEEAQAIADGPSILRYIRETASEHGVEEKIRFGHRMLGASWSSEDALWTVRAQRTHGGEIVELTCRFLYTCTGYYDYDRGYSPRFEGSERFQGRIVHPQQWPEDLDYGGKRVVVIGSGATAVTLVPAMADRAAHVTMLQRSPSYVFTLPGHDPIADALRRVLPPKAAYGFVRWKNVLLQMAFFNLSRRAPRLVRRLIRKGVSERLPAGYDVDTHFNPRYDPWDQRVCLVPGGDLFAAISAGKASVVTDSVETFTESGIRLASGRELEADVIVTATGLNLSIMGGATLSVDGRDVDFAETVGYKGMMFSGVPNMAMALGYTNASFTLKCDLVSQYVCRLLNHMDAHGYEAATPLEPDPSVPRLPFIDLKSGYVLRSIDSLPKQGDASPWRLHQNYFRDLRLLKHGPVDDAIAFSPRSPEAAGSGGAGAREPLAA